MPLEIRPFALGDTDAVVEIWEKCGLTNLTSDPRKEIRRKMKLRSDLFLVGTIDGKPVATVMAGNEGRRGWINYLGVHPEYQRRGYAHRMIEEAERLLKIESCPKINLQVRATNNAVLSFYKNIGYPMTCS